MFIQEALSVYQPQWIRGGVGLSFVCPGHPEAGHRLEVFFDNPLGGWALAREPGPFVHRLGDDLEDLTLASTGFRVEDPVVLLGHWRGWVARSVLIHSIRGVEW